jgi:hypothetical protein
MDSLASISFSEGLYHIELVVGRCRGTVFGAWSGFAYSVKVESSMCRSEQCRCLFCLFTVYLTTLSVPQTVQHRIDTVPIFAWRD